MENSNQSYYQTTEQTGELGSNPIHPVPRRPSFSFRFNDLFSSKHQKIGGLIGLIILILIPLTMYLAQKYTNFRPFATTAQASIFLAPGAQNLPPNSSFQVMVTSTTQKVGFARVEVTFDPTKVKLSSDPVASDVLTNVISSTTATQANATGKVLLVMALPAGSAAQAPIGTFRVGTLFFQAISTASSSTTIAINVANSQIVGMDSFPMALSHTDATLALNPTPTTSASPSPVSSLSIARVVMVNSTTGKDIKTIDTSTTLTADIATLPLYSFRFDPASSTVKSLKFQQIANYRPTPIIRIDNTIPFSAAGDGQGKYYPWDVGVGEYTMTLTPYSLPNAQGTAGTPLSFAVRVVDSSKTPIVASPLPSASPSQLPSPSPVSMLGIARVVMVNTDTGSDIRVLDTTSPITLSISQLPKYTFRYETNIAAGSVRHYEQANYRTTPTTHVDNQTPYSAVGYGAGKYFPWDVGVGTYKLTITPYTSANASGTAGQPLNFTVNVIE